MKKTYATPSLVKAGKLGTLVATAISKKP